MLERQKIISRVIVDTVFVEKGAYAPKVRNNRPTMGNENRRQFRTGAPQFLELNEADQPPNLLQSHDSSAMS